MLSGENVLVPPADISVRFREREFSAVLDANIVNQIAVTRGESILAPKFNFGAPAVSVRHMRSDGTLELEHEHRTDGRGLDIERARKVLEYVHRLWRRPVVLDTVNAEGKPQQITVG